jgi:hypothetical protein
MRVTLTIASLYALFMGVSGFLFEQLFFGKFSASATVAGIGATIAAVSVLMAFGGSNRAALIAFWSALAALGGVVLDAADYYAYRNSPGNDYTWELIGPFCLALAVIVYFTRSPLK